jgi:CRISPR-associated protein Csb1
MNFEEYLKVAGPVALTIREYLEPVHGPESVLFPPTFAPPQDKKDDKPSYVIDETETKDHQRKTRIALIDSVGSQANRLEPIFKREPYSSLIPQVSIQVNGRLIDLLDAGHRAADAVIRFSDLSSEFTKAFEAIRDRADSSVLAKISPTSLVFGVWDSRETRVKLPRIIGSVIRAYDVQALDRSAQFFSALEKEETETLGLTQDFLSNQGLSDAPAGRGPGGVIAHGGLIREATLNLIVVRSLSAANEAETTKLQQYILGLALIAFFADAELFLREGCLLTRSGSKPIEIQAVFRNGNREPVSANPEEIFSHARKAAEAFGVGPNRNAHFQPEKVKGVKAEADAKKAKKEKKV